MRNLPALLLIFNLLMWAQQPGVKPLSRPEPGGRAGEAGIPQGV